MVTYGSNTGSLKRHAKGDVHVESIMGNMHTRGRCLPRAVRGSDFKSLLLPWDYEHDDRFCFSAFLIERIESVCVSISG